MNQDNQKAKDIIKKNIYMVISSASLNGEPWISPVFFAYDDSYNLYWVSNKDSKHSNLLRENPKAAIVIFDSKAPEGEGDGVYFETKVFELTEEKEIINAINIFNNRASKDEFKVKSLERVTGEGSWRIYKAIPLKTYKLGNGEYINGQYVDKKIDVDLI